MGSAIFLADGFSTQTISSLKKCRSFWLLCIVYLHGSRTTVEADAEREVSQFLTPFLQVLSSSAASSTITALSPGGALMQGGTQQAVNRTWWATFFPFSSLLQLVLKKC
jgi:hypothetical protein